MTFRFTVTAQFFGAVDQLFGSERSPDGWPSRNDFLSYELGEALEELDEFEYDLEAVTLSGPERGTRVYVKAGKLVPFFALYMSLGPDGVIEIYHLSIHQGPLLDEPD